MYTIWAYGKNLLGDYKKNNTKLWQVDILRTSKAIKDTNIRSTANEKH